MEEKRPLGKVTRPDFLCPNSSGENAIMANWPPFRVARRSSLAILFKGKL